MSDTSIKFRIGVSIPDLILKCLSKFTLKTSSLSEEDVHEILDGLREGRTPKPGSRIDRFASEPINGLTSLTSPPTGPGFGMREDL